VDDVLYKRTLSTTDRRRVSKVRISIIFSKGSEVYCSNRWAQQREVFGKPLTSQAVIRAKLAQMIARVEGCQNWLENITYQMNNVIFYHLVFIG
jgi:Acyl-CoA dehydrogenase, C-terminal domain